MSGSEPKGPPPGISVVVDEALADPILMAVAKVSMIQAAVAVRDMEIAIKDMRKDMESGSPMNEGVPRAIMIRSAAEQFLSAMAWLDAMTTMLKMEAEGLSVHQEVVKMGKKAN